MKRYFHRTFLGLTVASLVIPTSLLSQDEVLPRASRVDRIAESGESDSASTAGTAAGADTANTNSNGSNSQSEDRAQGSESTTDSQEKTSHAAPDETSSGTAAAKPANDVARPQILYYGAPAIVRGWYDNRLDLGLSDSAVGRSTMRPAVRPAPAAWYSRDFRSSAAAQLQPEQACPDGCEPAPHSWLSGLSSWLVPSDHRFDDFISPLTNPVYFEDPRTLTEARFIYLRHQVPLTALGGEIQLFALQARAAVTDRLSIIVTKDGFITSSNPLIDDGWTDVNLGLKYNLLADPDAGRLLSAGLSYEIPIGSDQTLQGNGNGVFTPFLSGGLRVGNGHLLSTTGLLLPASPASESRIWYWSNHLDGRIGQSNFFWVGEVNWYHWLGAGEQTSIQGIPITGLEGGDLFNLGLAGVSGNDIVTGAVGLRYKPSGHWELGVAWEAPLTDRRDILDNRLTFDCILRY